MLWCHKCKSPIRASISSDGGLIFQTVDQGQAYPSISLPQRCASCSARCGTRRRASDACLNGDEERRGGDNDTTDSACFCFCFYFYFLVDWFLFYTFRPLRYTPFLVLIYSFPPDIIQYTMLLLYSIHAMQVILRIHKQSTKVYYSTTDTNLRRDTLF
jgi:hypothetical protein